MDLYTVAVGTLTYHFHSCCNDQLVLHFVIGSEVLYFIKRAPPLIGPLLNLLIGSIESKPSEVSEHVWSYGTS